MSKLNELADQITTDCAAMRNRPKPGGTYRVELTEEELNDVIASLESRHSEFVGYVREELDGGNGATAYECHQAAHDALALADKLREAEPVDPAGVLADLENKAVGQLNKVREIVERLDEAHVFQQEEYGFKTAICGPEPGQSINLTDVLDELTEALNADRG